MKDFRTGVSFYTTATAEIKFPEDDICCHWCQLLDREHGRDYCKMTGEILTAPDWTTGMICPLIFNKETET